jgi:hypothetical protein
VYGNIKKLRKKYNNMLLLKHRKYKEVLDYVESEMMILEIKTFKNGYINYKWDIPTKK